MVRVCTPILNLLILVVRVCYGPSLLLSEFVMHSSQLRLIPYLHQTSSVLRKLSLELLSEIFSEGGIKIISLSNIRPIIIYFHSSQCRLIPYLHQRSIFFKANSIHSSIVAILELIRGAQCLIEVIRSSGEEMWRVDAYQIPYYSRGIEEAKRTHPRFADWFVMVRVTRIIQSLYYALLSSDSADRGRSIIRVMVLTWIILRPLSALSLDEGLNALSGKNPSGCWLVQPTNQMSVISTYAH
jgi:hypothetical protein